jgi:hypothetical protein
MSLIGIYIDDDINAQQFATRLESDRLKIQLIEPAELVLLADRIIAESPAVVILDYRLDQLRGTRPEAVTYRAAPVAQHMRDRTGEHPNQDFPIVLISSEEKIRDLYRPEKTAHDLFDWKFIKQDVASSKDAASILISLVEGYALLRENIDDLQDPILFGLTLDQMYLIDYQELQEALKTARAPHIAARYLLNFVIRRQGLLIDKPNLLARIGIKAPAGDARTALEDWCAIARYSGVFSGCGERWWAPLIEAQLTQLLDSPPGHYTAAQRAKRLAEALNYPYEPAQDRWTESTNFSPVFACASCHSPTSLKHSLACLDAGLPSFVLRRRICYMCIMTDEYLSRRALDDDQELKLDASETRISDRIRSGEMPRGNK